MAKENENAYSELFVRLDAKRRKKERAFCQLVIERPRWKKDKDGNVLMSEESVLTRWKK